jgi:phytoene synthase
MKTIYDKVAADCSRITTQRYSTSFSLGIRFLAKDMHDPIYAIYGFVRFADEIVDTFDGYNQKYLLEKFKSDTYEAIEQRISLNPILNSFQQVVYDYNIDHAHIDTFLKSMEMDLHKIEYNTDIYNEYILGSAEVVGLMCLHVFTEGNKSEYEKLKPFAMKLGAAFQKVNFLRDMKHDFHILGRTYFPSVNMTRFTEKEKAEIEKDIEADFKEALKGIRMLPAASRAGVYLAYLYYKKLFLKIKQTSAVNVLKSRIRINNTRKIALMFSSMLRYRMNIL